MAIAKFEDAQKLFAGQGDLVIFDIVNNGDYTGATLASLTNPRSLGQIVQDSTTWEGEDVSTDEILDEQGNLITARVTAGTLGFSFDIASTSPTMVKTFLAGSDISGTSLPGLFFDGDTADNTVSAVGFGTALPVMTRPIAILNDELNRAWIYPKAKITANLTLADGLYRIHAVVLAENVDHPIAILRKITRVFFYFRR